MARIRYTKTEQAPKLTAAVVALGLVASTGTEAQKLAAITKLQDDTASYTNTETNVFLENIANKVLLQTVFKRMQFKDPIVKHFFKEGVSFSASKEIIDNKLLKSHNFDGGKRYPDDQNKAKILNKILNTAAKKYLTNTVQTIGVRAAFVSDQAFGEWIAKQTDLLQESLQVELFEQLSPIIISSVKNVITLGATFNTWDKIFVEINRISKRMATIPSVKYNMGFADPTDKANANFVRKQILPRDKQLLISSPDVINSLDGEVSTVKFNNQYFKVDQYGGTMSLDMPNTEIILADVNAYTGYFRVNQIASQFWAGNMTIEYFLHYWYTFGYVPWANGVKFVFTEPTQGTSGSSDEPDTSSDVETVNIDTPKDNPLQ